MFHYASEICIEKAKSFQGSDFDANILQTVLKRGLRRRWQYQSANKMSW
jgi:hypothetical protein